MPEWFPHLEHLLWRSAGTLWSWSSLGWAAIAVSVVVFLAKLTRQTRDAYRIRYTRFSFGSVMKEVGSAIRPTIISFDTLIALSGWVILFMVAIGVTVYREHEDLVISRAALSRKLKESQDAAIRPSSTPRAAHLVALYGDSPLNGKMLGKIEGGGFYLDLLRVTNDGNAQTSGDLSARIYFSSNVRYPRDPGWQETISDDRSYPSAYYLGVNRKLSVGEPWNILEFIGDSGDATFLKVKLMVFYGGDAPAEAHFTLASKQAKR
jgi:hypothetical protein